MSWKRRFHIIVVAASIAILTASGCAKKPYWETTESGTMKFTQTELERLPNVSIRRILSQKSETKRNKINVFVRSKSLDGSAEVNRLAGQEDVIVTNKNGKEVRIKISQISEAEIIRRYKVEPRKKTPGEVGETLCCLPFVPLAIASTPFLRASGHDAVKNADDKEKAMLAYGGMSKEDLVTHLGEPEEKYYCRKVKGSGDGEVWLYDKDKVLRGGRAIFINLKRGDVYSTSHNTTAFKKSNWQNCTLIDDSGDTAPK